MTLSILAHRATWRPSMDVPAMRALVGASAADRTMADRLGIRFESSSLFFG